MGRDAAPVFGEYRAPTGVRLVVSSEPTQSIEDVRKAVAALAVKLGASPDFSSASPGLTATRTVPSRSRSEPPTAAWTVIYEGIRLTPDEIVATAKQHGVHILGLSILSGSHVALVREVMNRMRASGLGDVPVVVGGIVPAEDVNILKQLGVKPVYTPKDYRLNELVTEIAGLVAETAEA